jgi:serine/threonine protein phosphatase PrpC
MHAYEHACRATQGARHYQEDMAAFLAVTDARGADVASGAATRALVCVLADGMGGHAGGAVASQLVCEGFLDAMRDWEPARATPEQLTRALDHCNAGLAERVATEPMLNGMGSTLIGVALGADGIEWISVGDSPLYLWRRGEIAQLNADHSLAPELDQLAKSGHMTAAAAAADPRRHMLRSAVTGEEIDMIDLSGRPAALYPGDYVILASDGLQSLDEEEIARIVGGYAEAGAEAVAEALIRAVEDLRVPHQDNATVVVVRPVAN